MESIGFDAVTLEDICSSELHSARATLNLTVSQSTGAGGFGGLHMQCMQQRIAEVGVTVTWAMSQWGM